MKQIYDELARRTSAGETVATATVIRTRGSTPREVGAKMLVNPTSLVGTVGGGYPEGEAHRASLEAIAEGEARIIEVDLTEQITYDARGVCGGVMEMLIEPWSDSAEATRISSALAASGRIGVVTTINRVDGRITTDHVVVAASGDPVGESDSGRWATDRIAEARAAVLAGQTGMIVETPGADAAPICEIFVEVQMPPPTMLVCGAGHIAVPLAMFAKALGFRVVVIDDRTEFANRDRFPDVDEVITEEFADAVKGRVDVDTYVVLVTRGHSHDVDCLFPIIDQQCAYIGMIGSKRRVFAVHKLLHELGVPPEWLQRIHAPIGIDIGAETPAEIAVSIVAEIVRVRKGGGAPLLSDGVRERYAELVAKGEELE